jgi:hypothetical protein
MSTPQHHDTHSLDQECTPDDIRYRVLLALPTETYIPIFAMGVEARRRQCETTVLDPREELSRHGWLAAISLGVSHALWGTSFDPKSHSYQPTNGALHRAPEAATAHRAGARQRTSAARR